MSLFDVFVSSSRDRMDQPKATRSNPAEKRLARDFQSVSSSDQATEVTIRWWVWLVSRGNLVNFCPVCKSWITTCRLSCGIAIKPQEEIESRLTAADVWMLVIGALIFLKSQTLTVRSSEPETICSDRGKQAHITASVWPWNTDTEWIVSRKSQSRKVESMLQVATNLWVGWQATCVNSRSWPAKVCNKAPLSTLYKLAVLQKTNFSLKGGLHWDAWLRTDPNLKWRKVHHSAIDSHLQHLDDLSMQWWELWLCWPRKTVGHPVCPTHQYPQILSQETLHLRLHPLYEINAQEQRQLSRYALSHPR